MSTEIKKEVQLEIAHVLFIDIVGSSKLSISDQHAAIEESNQLVRASEQFQRAEAASRLLKIPTGDGMAPVFYTSPEAPAECAAALPQLRSYRTAVRLGTKETFSVDLYNVVIANGRFVAGGLPIAPNADPSDGLLDIILIPERPGSEITLLAAKIVLGNHLDAVVFRRAARVSIRSRPGMWFTVDGEPIGNDPIVFEVMPRALQFVVGKR
jgi:hypothetical protein